jgi:hypothetical protein
MRGLIAAALGGVSRGVGQVAERQIEVNSRKALMEAEEEMNARLAEAAEVRAIAAEGRAETRQIGAESRRLANIPLETEAIATAEEGVMSRRYSEGSQYPGLVAQQLRVQRTPEQELELERSQGLLGDDQQIRDLRQTIATMPENDPALPGLKRQLGILTGGTSRLDPMVELAMDDLASRGRRLEIDYERAVRDFDDAEIARITEKLDALDVERQRILGRSSDDPLGLL